MRKNKNRSKIILAFIVAILATMFTYTTFNKMQTDLVGKEKMLETIQTINSRTQADNYAYAVAVKDLKAGEIVSDSDIDFKQSPIEDATAFENRSELVNKVLLQDILAGATFTNTHIARVSGGDLDSTTLRNGYRSLTLPAENFQGKSNKMVAGASVDIFSASNDEPWALENVKILSFEGSGMSVAKPSDKLGDKQATSLGVPTIMTASSINFEVPVGSISDFITNASKGRLVLVARNPNDKRVYRKNPTYTPSYPTPQGGSRSSMRPLPNLPANVPITSLPGGSDISGLPAPIKPAVPSQEVEMIEANVKSKVTFD